MENSEIKKLHNLAESIAARSSREIYQSWENDAKEAAERLSSDIKLFNVGGYGNRVNPLSFPKKALSILAARTGGGKTTTMLNVAISFAVNGKKGIFVTLEEPEFSLATKSMSIFDCRMRGVELAHTASQFKFMMKRGQISEWPLWNDYRRDIMPNLIFIDANKMTKQEDIAQPNELYDPRILDMFMDYFQGKIEFAFVDYIQLMSTGEYHNNAYVNIKQVMQAVRYMCGQHPVSIIMGAQLNREAAKLDMTDWTPEMLREAADIEQGANMIIGMDRVYNAQNDVSYAMRVLKNRDDNPMQNAIFDVSFPHQFIGPEPICEIPENN